MKPLSFYFPLKFQICIPYPVVSMNLQISKIRCVNIHVSQIQSQLQLSLSSCIHIHKYIIHMHDLLCNYMCTGTQMEINIMITCENRSTREQMLVVILVSEVTKHCYISCTFCLWLKSPLKSPKLWNHIVMIILVVKSTHL